MKLDWPDKQGISLREHYVQAGYWRELEEPEVPPPVARLWGWFWELHSSRGAGMAGPDPITYADILAWREFTMNSPSPWEVEVIRALDRAYLEFASNKAKEK